MLNITDNKHNGYSTFQTITDSCGTISFFFDVVCVGSSVTKCYISTQDTIMEMHSRDITLLIVLL